MRIYSYKEFSWEKGMLYLGVDYTGISIRSDMDNPEMYWIMFPEGESQDFYNKTRAKDNAVQYAMDLLNQGKYLMKITQETP